MRVPPVPTPEIPREQNEMAEERFQPPIGRRTLLQGGVNSFTAALLPQSVTTFVVD